MRAAFVTAVLVAAALALARVADAQARELHWKSLAVDARLDAEGALRVEERHHILFSGDWNGGERTFDLPYGQMVELRGVRRIDPATGEERELTRGALERIDEYDEHWGSESLTVRWRSRRPSDPPFDRTPIVYVLDYVLYGALEQVGDVHRFDHDFAFERPSRIDELTVRMTIDPSWRVHGRLPSEWTAKNLGPGEAFVVRAELSGNAALSQRRDALQLILIAVPCLLVLAFVWLERRRGRFAPLEPVPITDPQFLAEHLFRHPPELVSVLWNRSSPRAAAVAALLARLELDAKIRTEVSADGQLQMQLLVDRAELQGYERAFLDGFFFAGDTTSTAAVRAHYKKSGFNPAAPLRVPLGERMRALVGPFEHFAKPIWLPLIVLALGCFCLLTPPGDGVARVLVVVLPGTAVAIGGCLLAAFWRRRLDFGLRHTPMFLAFALIPVAVGFAWLENGSRGWSFGALLGVVLVALAYFKLILGFARSNEPAAGFALRRKLTACRRQLQDELSEPHEFTESIVPYIFAFGLGKAAKAWFVQAQRRDVHGTVRSGSYASSGSSGNGSPSYRGGGGGFGGAGASGAWVSAVGAMSAGVSSPSSSSSSGRGGGSRSGGGSAGGW